MRLFSSSPGPPHQQEAPGRIPAGPLAGSGGGTGSPTTGSHDADCPPFRWRRFGATRGGWPPATEYAVCRLSAAYGALTLRPAIKLAEIYHR